MPFALAREPLEVFRCFYCGTLAALVLVRLPSDFRFLRHRGEARETPRLFGLFALPRIAPSWWLAGGLILVALLASASLDVAPVATLFLASISALFHFAQLADSPVVHRKANTVPVILALLGAATLSGTDVAAISNTTRMIIKLVVAQVYLSAGLTKLRDSGWRWSDGETLRYWFAYYHLRDGHPLLLALAGSRRSCRIAATFTLLFELTFWLVIPFPWLAWIYLPGALFFHVATARLFRIHYWIYFGPAYLIFLAEYLAPTR